jgi:hypothetical protein
MKLFVCWGTFPTIRPGGHPCASAYNALTGAGYDIVAWAEANPAP